MEKINECKIVQDLLINYADDVLSSESKEFVNLHLVNCKYCQSRLKVINEDLENIENKEKLEVDYLKKVRMKNKIKSVIMAVMIIFIIFFIYYLLKFLKVNDIIHKSEKYSNLSNYYTEHVSGTGEYASVIKTYCKDGKKKEVLITYSDDGMEINQERYLDSSKKEIIIVDYKNNIVTIENGKFAELMNSQFEYKVSLLDKIQKTITWSIKMDNYMLGKDYYVIKDCYDKNNREEEWVDKDTGLVLRRISREAEITYFPGTHIRKCVNDIIEDISYEFENVTDDDIKLPDLSGFEVVKRDGGVLTTCFKDDVNY